MAYQQFQKDGTWYAYDADTQQGVAFATPADLSAFFEQQGGLATAPDPSAPELPDSVDTASFDQNANQTEQTLSYFFTPSQIAAMDPTTKSALAAFTDVTKKQYSSGVTNWDINAQTWNDAMNLAQSNPDIKAKYGDMAVQDLRTLNDSVSQLTAGYNETTAANQRQADTDTQNLGKTIAAAGQSYSGFAEKAKENLQKTQSDVVTSTRRNMQQSVSSATRQYEQKYGTDSAQKVVAGQLPSDVNSGLAGGTTGSSAASQNADVLAKATSNYSAVTPTSATGAA